MKEHSHAQHRYSPSKGIQNISQPRGRFCLADIPVLSHFHFTRCQLITFLFQPIDCGSVQPFFFLFFFFFKRKYNNLNLALHLELQRRAKQFLFSELGIKQIPHYVLMDHRDKNSPRFLLDTFDTERLKLLSVRQEMLIPLVHIHMI